MGDTNFFPDLAPLVADPLLTPLASSHPLRPAVQVQVVTRPGAGTQAAPASLAVLLANIGTISAIRYFRRQVRRGRRSPSP